MWLGFLFRISFLTIIIVNLNKNMRFYMWTWIFHQVLKSLRWIYAFIWSLTSIGLINVQNCLLIFSNINQSACSTLDWVVNT